MHLKRILFTAAATGLALAAIGCVNNANAASAKAPAKTSAKTAPVKWVFGPAKNIGNGKAGSFIKLDAKGNPLALGYTFSDKCLTGLPPGKFNAPAIFNLEMPKENPTGFDHLEMDWNAQGHDPKPIYGVPHFDFHFYLCDDAMLNMVMGGPDKVPVEAKYIPTDYVSGVDSVPHMGTHWIDRLTPEFHGKPFTATYIYGFYHGDMKFVEPMIALSFLQSKKPFHLNIKQPQAFQHHAWYPRQMRLQYEASSHHYFLTLYDLVKH